jgi:CheY-like chemotaxis protein
VIDDCDDVLEYFEHILSSFTMECKTAASGRQGIEALRDSVKDGKSYNMAFIDWKLPGEDSTEVVREIQRITDNGITIVVMSVADWVDIESSIQPLHIRQFLSKPILPSTLYNTIVSLSNYKGIVEQQGRGDETVDLTGKLSGQTILIVEDIEINQEILASILEDTGIFFEFANNGVIAVDMFKKRGELYTLILMDVQMPELDGLGATRQIRALNTETAAKIPIIAMTANAFNEDVNACLEAGMNDHLAKPIDVGEFMKVLAKYVKK